MTDMLQLEYQEELVAEFAEVEPDFNWSAILDAINLIWDEMCNRTDELNYATLAERVRYVMAQAGGPEAFSQEDLVYMQRFIEISDARESLDEVGDYQILFYYGGMPPDDEDIVWEMFPDHEMLLDA